MIDYELTQGGVYTPAGLSDSVKTKNAKNKNIIWSPQDKQFKFQQRPEYEALYGGAAGGGKSDSLLTEALRQVHIPHYKGIIFRKTFKQLSELIERSTVLYKAAYPGAKYNGSGFYWRFPSGALIYFANMQSNNYKINYQGKAYDFVGFDELTHFTYEEYSYMFSRNRPTGAGTRVYLRATTNPGGVGHGWVKERFITAAEPFTPIIGIYEIPDGRGNIYKVKKKRIFIPSTVFDNKKLLDNDPMYLANLAMLPEAERNALLYGDWNSFSGQVFREWKNESEHYIDRVNTHVIEPFEFSPNWQVIRSFDWGYSRPFAVGWYAFDEFGRMYRVAELYGCTGEPNTGVKYEPSQVAKLIKEQETTHPLLKGRKIWGVADPAIFDEQHGASIASIMEANQIYFEKADNKRLPGKMQIHYRLAFDKEGIPMFYCFNTCKHFIRTIPNLVYDEIKVEDIDTKQEDHIYDEFRYAAMEKVISSRKNEYREIPLDDPLNLFSDERRDNYSVNRFNYINI